MDVTEVGLIGDRAYSLIDAETGKVVSAKNPKLWPDLFGCRAAFLEPPRAAGELPPVRITLANGKWVNSDAPNAQAILSDFFRRDIRLARAAPEDFTIDQYHPDVQDVEPTGQVMSIGLRPCAGLYAVVDSAGTMRKGDRVVLA